MANQGRPAAARMPLARALDSDALRPGDARMPYATLADAPRRGGDRRAPRPQCRRRRSGWILDEGCATRRDGGLGVIRVGGGPGVDPRLALPGGVEIGASASPRLPASPPRAPATSDRVTCPARPGGPYPTRLGGVGVQICTSVFFFIFKSNTAFYSSYTLSHDWTPRI